jgi:hypothetical protein
VSKEKGKKRHLGAGARKPAPQIFFAFETKIQTFTGLKREN